MNLRYLSALLKLRMKEKDYNDKNRKILGRRKADRVKPWKEKQKKYRLTCQV